MIAARGHRGDSEQRRQTPMRVALVDMVVRPQCGMIARPREDARVGQIERGVDVGIAEWRVAGER